MEPVGEGGTRPGDEGLTGSTSMYDGSGSTATGPRWATDPPELKVKLSYFLVAPSNVSAELCQHRGRRGDNVGGGIDGGTVLPTLRTSVDGSAGALSAFLVNGGCCFDECFLVGGHRLANCY